MSLIKYFIAGNIGGIGVNLLKTNNDFWMNLIGVLLIVLPVAALSYYEGYTDGKKDKK